MKAVQVLLPADTEQITRALRRSMDAKELQMYDLALFCETEMLKAHKAKAHLAGCLMGAAMNEALLALMCLRYESTVRQTTQYKHSTKRKQGRSYREVIGDWHFDQFICVAEDCEWIPSEIVDQNFKTALAEGFLELAPISHPELTEEQLRGGAESFYTSPGTAMLRMCQMLRNSIHAGRWIKSKGAFMAENFMQWCEFATHLNGEIRLCLLNMILNRDLPKVVEQMEQVAKTRDQLPPDYREMFDSIVRTELGQPAT